MDWTKYGGIGVEVYLIVTVRLDIILGRNCGCSPLKESTIHVMVSDDVFS